MRTILRVLIGAFALWITTLTVGGSGQHGVWIESPRGAALRNAGTGPLSDTADPYGPIITLLLVALVFGIVNSTLGTVVRVVSIPLYIITFGLFGLIVNGFMFAIVVWLSDLVGFGLRTDSFWWGVLGALVMSLIAGILNGILGTRKSRDRGR